MPYRKIVNYGDLFLHWLFSGVATRVVEFLNAAFLIGFTIPLIYNIETILTSKPYMNIYSLANPFWWGCMAILGFLQWFAMARKSISSNQLSGYILMVSGGAWTFTASLFISQSPTPTPATIIYLITAVICLAAGFHMLRLNKQIEDAQVSIIENK